jgi:hypothetical protein
MGKLLSRRWYARPVKRFIVTGCPRSGTRYMATLLEALGPRVGHEKVFGIREGLGTRDPRWKKWEGDVSWLAVPFLPVEDTVVLHQVRHPLEFVRSVLGFGFLSDERAELPFPQVVRRHAPEVYEPGAEAERGATMWKVWNERVVPHADFTYRLEDFDLPLLMRMCELIELDVPEEKAAQAFAEVPTTINQRARDESVSWDAIASIVGDSAGRFGYDVVAQR